MTTRFAPWVTDTGSWITIRQPRTRRCRDRIVNAAASCDISILLGRNWFPLMGSQRGGCDARGCNCGAKNQFETFAMIPFSASGKTRRCSSRRRLHYIAANSITPS